MTRIKGRQRRREATYRRGYEDGHRAAISSADPNCKAQPCECIKIEQDETCPVGFPSLVCEVCHGKGLVPHVKLDGPELWEIVFGVNSDAATDITDEQYDLIARHINKVFILPLEQDEAPESEGVKAIAAERQRQIEKEGWAPEHDDKHSRGELARAAACYALQAAQRSDETPYEDRPGRRRWWRTHFAIIKFWPWDWGWWKPVDRQRDLEKAGALIAAELDRVIRAAALAKQEGGRDGQ